MPLAAPVITAILSFKRMTILLATLIEDNRERLKRQGQIGDDACRIRFPGPVI
jgi:hypothetical protein